MQKFILPTILCVIVNFCVAAPFEKSADITPIQVANVSGKVFRYPQVSLKNLEATSLINAAIEARIKAKLIASFGVTDQTDINLSDLLLQSNVRISEMNYKVMYNGRGFLSLTVLTQTANNELKPNLYLNFNTTNGKELQIGDLFSEAQENNILDNFRYQVQMRGEDFFTAFAKNNKLSAQQNELMTLFLEELSDAMPQGFTIGNSGLTLISDFSDFQKTLGKQPKKEFLYNNSFVKPMFRPEISAMLATSLTEQE